jgi:hypothetical protein
LVGSEQELVVQKRNNGQEGGETRMEEILRCKDDTATVCTIPRQSLWEEWCNNEEEWQRLETVDCSWFKYLEADDDSNEKNVAAALLQRAWKASTRVGTSVGKASARVGTSVGTRVGRSLPLSRALPPPVKDALSSIYGGSGAGTAEATSEGIGTIDSSAAEGRGFSQAAKAAGDESTPEAAGDETTPEAAGDESTPGAPAGSGMKQKEMPKEAADSRVKQVREFIVNCIWEPSIEMQWDSVIFDRFVSSLCETICGLQFLAIVSFLSQGYNGHVFLLDYNNFHTVENSSSMVYFSNSSIVTGITGTSHEKDLSHYRSIMYFVCANIGVELLQAVIHWRCFNWFTTNCYDPVAEFQMLFIGLKEHKSQDAHVGGSAKDAGHPSSLAFTPSLLSYSNPLLLSAGMLISLFIFLTFITQHVYFLIAVKAFVGEPLLFNASHAPQAT